MTEDIRALEEELLATARTMLAKGLVEGTAGNISARLPDGNVVMTPSSVEYDTMTLDDLVVVDLDGQVVEGTRTPTTERALHLACYRRYPEVGAVMHSHAKHATMFAVTRQPIPAVIEEFVVYVGGDVPVCDYRLTGSEELGEEVARRLADTSAVLMANHGLCTIGPDLKKALQAAELVERTAEIIWGARVLGPLVPIPEETTANFRNVYRFLRENPM
ncbi:MAG: class II aldolase/adducin family protein [Acidimicrobiia bacterium]|nr:class II aldolase/adducin family protein [Acidimicrobiia bacterium]